MPFTILTIDEKKKIQNDSYALRKCLTTHHGDRSK